MDYSRVIGIFRSIGRSPEVLRCVRTSKNWPTLVGAYLGLTRPRFPLDFVTPHGDKLTLETMHDLITAWIIFYRDEYPVDPSSRTIIDAGANIGAFSLLAARIAPDARIIAVEPFPSTRSRLESHIAGNGLASRVTCLPWALARSDDRRVMPDADVPSQSRGLSDRESDAPGTSVETVTLETLLVRTGLERVDLLKIDIEGSEHEVFLSSSDSVLRRFKAIALEYHPNRPKSTLFDRLRSAGFRVIRDLETPGNPDGGVALLERGQSDLK